jgi:hypothetical protein
VFHAKKQNRKLKADGSYVKVSAAWSIKIFFLGLHMFIFSMGYPLHVFALQMSSSYKQLDGSTASLCQILGKNVWLQTHSSNVVAAISDQSIRGLFLPSAHAILC